MEIISGQMNNFNHAEIICFVWIKTIKIKHFCLRVIHPDCQQIIFTQIFFPISNALSRKTLYTRFLVNKVTCFLMKENQDYPF